MWGLGFREGVLLGALCSVVICMLVLYTSINSELEGSGIVVAPLQFLWILNLSFGSRVLDKGFELRAEGQDWGLGFRALRSSVSVSSGTSRKLWYIKIIHYMSKLRKHGLDF